MLTRWPLARSAPPCLPACLLAAINPSRYAITRIADQLATPPPLFRPKLPCFDHWQLEHAAKQEMKARLSRFVRYRRLHMPFRFWLAFTRRNLQVLGALLPPSHFPLVVHHPRFPLVPRPAGIRSASLGGPGDWHRRLQGGALGPVPGALMTGLLMRLEYAALRA